MKRILIVEDDDQIANGLRLRLQANGFGAFVAADAVQAARMAGEYDPDLIILDISIPGGNGLKLGDSLANRPETQGIPIVFLTANHDPELRRRASASNAAGYFEKPYEIEDLLTLIRVALKDSEPGGSSSKRRPGKSANGPARRTPKILVVEDDEKIAMALALRLKGAGYEPTLAFDALLGLSTAMRTGPDLVILDISMPAGNGLELAEKLQMVLPKVPPLIFLTASKQPGLREKAQQLGAAAFFEKPYEAEELMAAVDIGLRTESEKLL